MRRPALLIAIKASIARQEQPFAEGQFVETAVNTARVDMLRKRLIVSEYLSIFDFSIFTSEFAEKPLERD